MGSESFDNWDGAAGEFASLGIDIDTLAALVEGDLGCQEADELLERILQADPDRAAALEMMMRDRVMLRTLGDETPPVGLGEAILARLERDALLELRDPTDAPHPIPVSRITQVNSRSWFMRHPVIGLITGTGVLATAAGLLVLISNPAQPTPTTTPPGAVGPVATNDQPAPPTITTPAADNATDTSSKAAVSEDTSSQVPSSSAVLAAGPTHETLPVSTLADMPAADPSSMTASRPSSRYTIDNASEALKLLDQGRLIVCVQSTKPAQTTRILARAVSATSSASQAWTLQADVPQAMLASVDALLTPDTPQAPEPMLMADSIATRQYRKPDPASAKRTHTRPDKPTSTLKALYLADTRHDAAALASLRASLSLGDGQRADFQVLDTPLPIEPVITEQTILWWSKPPSQWHRRVHVPIVVEAVNNDQ